MKELDETMEVECKACGDLIDVDWYLIEEGRLSQCECSTCGGYLN